MTSPTPATPAGDYVSTGSRPQHTGSFVSATEDSTTRQVTGCYVSTRKPSGTGRYIDTDFGR